ncbi:nucleoside hydrolase [Prolixibacteraceae bacterium Z1-6]|uniref:Nucleoside hydrolase n=1 Tax=Draconibacterium aestuarii TaxID=2998507 RepID=A0A9X3J856_9BACT|nr:nucleoside hydrolase [Prolixibacteraceae bacterium Z1-6]
MKIIFVVIILLNVVVGFGSTQKSKDSEKLKILIDSDANNELDDQHALAYSFLNKEVFDVVGVTVNNTRNGYGIQGQYDEAERIIKLFDLEEKVPLFMGADKNYEEIAPFILQPDFDGHAAVDFIIQEAMKMKDEKLILVPVGKLTNIALAFLKEPRIIDKVRVVWLGSNYPEPGEYNLVNDISSVNPVIGSGVEFEMVTVRYSQPTGTAAVTVTPAEMKANMKDAGPVSSSSIIGRHGGEFNRFGDYSSHLFEKAEMYGNPPSRALFDMVVLAILKNESWGQKKEIPAPKLVGEAWEDQPDNANKIVIWENFNRDAIVTDLFELMKNSTPKQ